MRRARLDVLDLPDLGRGSLKVELSFESLEVALYLFPLILFQRNHMLMAYQFRHQTYPITTGQRLDIQNDLFLSLMLRCKLKIKNRGHNQLKILLEARLVLDTVWTATRLERCEAGQSQDLDHVHCVFVFVLKDLIDSFCDLSPQTVRPLLRLFFI